MRTAGKGESELQVRYDLAQDQVQAATLESLGSQDRQTVERDNTMQFCAGFQTSGISNNSGMAQHNEAYRLDHADNFGGRRECPGGCGMMVRRWGNWAINRYLDRLRRRNIHGTLTSA